VDEQVQPNQVSKSLLLQSLQAEIDRELLALTQSQHEASKDVIHEESRAEHSKDTRATETSYLARGLAERVVELERDRAMLSSLTLHEFTPDEAVALTAIVSVEREDSGKVALYFIAPVGGGAELVVDGTTIRALTPASPIGRALMGREVGDEIEIRAPGGGRNDCIVSIR
jgi:transcription elongation GreA/GreB family factor